MQSRGREPTYTLTRTYEPTVNFARQSHNETADTVQTGTPDASPEGSDRYPRRWGMPWRRIFE